MLKKQMSIILVFTLIIYSVMSLGLFGGFKVYASQSREPVSSKLNNYPEYTTLINNLQQKHPNWTFTMFYTGLDWSQVIKNETTVVHARNLVPSSKTGDWICSICGDKLYDNGTWKCASEAAVGYYMDPRNFLYEDYIFQFETLSFNGNIQTVDGVRQILSGCNYLLQDNITYKKTDGSTGVINKTYSQVIYDAAKNAGISPYHLAARIKQEQGTGNAASATARGDYAGYIGLYNFLNINAYGDKSEIVPRALTYARDNGWTDPEKSIIGGAQNLAKRYIASPYNQDTLYLQKFDVDSSNGAIYQHQYMQNLMAACNEGETVRNSYNNLGLLNSAMNFVIPVYENMPSSPSPMPGTHNIVTQNVKIKGSNINVREDKSTSSNIITTLNSGDVILRIELASNQTNGYYWDKVVLADGRKGYISTQYLEKIADVTNTLGTVKTTTGVNLRNGPGTSGTTVITMLTSGQILTRIETGKYNGLDGFNWDRVKLADGRQGYIATNYITSVSTSTNDGQEVVKVICGSGLKLRAEPGTGSTTLRIVNNGELLTRTQKGASNANGYVWDKVVTSDGLVGYIARGDSSGDYIQVIQSGNNNTTQTPAPTPQPEQTPTDNVNFKLEGTELICEPATTVASVKSKHKDAVVKKNGTQLNDSDLIGTGYIVLIDGKEYTVIKKGDANGDGRVSAGDYVKIKNHIMETSLLSGVYIKGADVNSDGRASAGDYVKVKNYIMETGKITI